MFSHYASKQHQILDIIHKLRDAGAQAELDLPCILVSGNQSSGKSSLLEGLCQLQLPRSQGTCTRSVTEVRLSTCADHPWSASVKLRSEYHSDGKPLKLPNTLLFIDNLHSPSEIELWIKRAQKALLNPSQPHTKYLNESSFNTPDELKFTKNTVCIEVTGILFLKSPIGASVNLTLIDLPGIIRNVDHPKDQIYIDLIQDLVSSFIKKERAILLATISCKDDIENQAILQLAKQADPYGSRTLGVLTKPDTIEKGTHEKWVQLIHGSQYALKLGYWMVRCPSQAELDSGVSQEDAKKLETSFFQSTYPWSDLSRSLNRFGMDVLRSELSRLLSQLCDLSLPDLKAKAEQAMHLNSKELAAVAPAVSENPRIELLHLVRNFCSIVNYNVIASQEFKTFYQKIRVHFEDFKTQLNASKPVFSLADAIDKGSFKSSQSSLTSTLSNTISSVIPSGISGWMSPNEVESKKEASSPSTIRKPVLEKIQVDIHKPLSISDLKRIIDSQKGRELHGYSPYGAFSHLIQAYQEDWSKLATNLLSAVALELQNLVQKVAKDIFGRFMHLSSQLKLLLAGYLDELYRKTFEQISHLVAMERRFPFTMGSEEFNLLRLNALSDFKAQLESVKNHGYGVKTETIHKAIAALAEAGFTGLSPRDLTKLKESPIEDEALQVMAGTDAYFRLAIKRFGDNVPMAIDFFFLTRCGESLEKEVISRLGLLEKDMDALSALLQEDRHIVEKRSFLLAQRSRLEQVWKLLHQV